MQTYSTFYNADDLGSNKGMMNAKMHYRKRSFQAEIDMHAHRSHNAVGGFDQN